jgi:hypothetical protein
LKRLPSSHEFLLRSATVTVKFGLKVGAMLSSLVLALVCFVGCNSDEGAAPAAGTGPGATKPVDKGPAAAPAPKPDEKK